MNALILCNGQPPPQHLFEEMVQWSDLFIAADGGGNIARSMGMLPEVVIGDLDSFEKKDNESVSVTHKPSQYANDLEKALTLATENGIEQVKVLGATGLRLDHTLKNLSVLKQFNGHFNQLSFHDAYGTTQLLPKTFSDNFQIGQTLSLFPLSGKVTGVSTTGLKYPLEDDVLENGVRDGSSNEVVANPVTITYKIGDLLLFIAK